jgi:tripartite ATP-independent transporter DctM subunit
MGLLVVVVLGGIYGGIASPTEVAALGASLSIMITIVSRCFSFGAVWRAGVGTVRQASMILMVIFTAKILAMTLIYFQVPAAVVAWIMAAELTVGHIYVAVVVIYLVLGMFVDGIAMMVITIPFIVPIMAVAHMDPIWMGVVICILIEMGLLTPPVGLNLYVLQGVTGESMRDVIVGSWPFIVVQFAMIGALYQWPQIALYLPRILMGS